MDKIKEIPKIQRILKIPISDIIINAGNVEIISGKTNIGGIPCYIVSNDIRYDDSKEVVNWLNWESVYLENQSEIDGLIKLLDETKDIDISISLGTFRHLFINNQKGDFLFKVICTFENEKWSIKKVQ